MAWVLKKIINFIAYSDKIISSKLSFRYNTLKILKHRIKHIYYNK